MPATTLPCTTDTTSDFVGEHMGQAYYRVEDAIYLRVSSGMGGFNQCFLLHIANPPVELTVTS